jgi:hypothetical protein
LPSRLPQDKREAPRKFDSRFDLQLSRKTRHVNVKSAGMITERGVIAALTLKGSPDFGGEECNGDHTIHHY